MGEGDGPGVTESTPMQAMGTNCWAHKHTELVPLEVHHVWPLGEGGPNIAANKISICSNAHSSAHDLLAKMLKAADGLLPWRSAAATACGSGASPRPATRPSAPGRSSGRTAPDLRLDPRPAERPAPPPRGRPGVVLGVRPGVHARGRLVLVGHVRPGDVPAAVGQDATTMCRVRRPHWSPSRHRPRTPGYRRPSSIRSTPAPYRTSVRTAFLRDRRTPDGRDHADPYQDLHAARRLGGDDPSRLQGLRQAARARPRPLRRAVMRGAAAPWRAGIRRDPDRWPDAPEPVPCEVNPQLTTADCHHAEQWCAGAISARTTAPSRSRRTR
jgi:hypothetical protein